MSKLPGWAKIEDGRICIDPGVAYPEALKARGIAVAEADQYWLEVARRCCEERVTAIARSDLEILNELGSTIITRRILRDDKYALNKFPEGKGAAAGSMEFRQHYQMYLNGLPK